MYEVKAVWYGPIKGEGSCFVLFPDKTLKWFSIPPEPDEKGVEMGAEDWQTAISEDGYEGVSDQEYQFKSLADALARVEAMQKKRKRKEVV